MINEQLQLEKKKVIALCSGGPDSIYLVNYLLKEKKDILVLHINYQKRANSILDQKVVENICKKNNLPLVIKLYSSDKKGNFQANAREYRYDAACEIAKKERRVIYVGHQFDDNLETIIFQKRRKSIAKYFGIKKITSWNNISIIRPLLNIKKKEIIYYLDQNKITYRIDESNLSNVYERNRIRKYIKKLTYDQAEEIICEAHLKNKTLLKKNKNKELYFYEIFKNNEINLEKLKEKSKEDYELTCVLMIEYLNQNKLPFTRKKIENIIGFLINKNNSTKFFRISNQWLLIKNKENVKLLAKNTHQ